MTTVTNINATVPASTPVAATSAVSSAPQQDSTQATATTDSSASSSGGGASSVVTSRLVSDPLARVLITQFVDGNNNVVSQNPVSAVVAYLQNGLTADGFSKQSQSA